LSVGDIETGNEAGRYVPRAIEEAECVNEVSLLDEATKYAGELRMGPGMQLGASVLFFILDSFRLGKSNPAASTPRIPMLHFELSLIYLPSTPYTSAVSCIVQFIIISLLPS
jgi:hypothetical protein